MFWTLPAVGLLFSGMTLEAERPTNIVDGMALMATRWISPIKSEIEQIWASGGYSTTTLEIANAIHLAENPDNERCNLNGCEYGIGAMQIVQSTFDEQCKGSVYNKNDNIRCGLKMIENEDFWRWEQSMFDMPKHRGWLGRLSTSTRLYVEEKMIPYNCVAYLRTKLDFPPTSQIKVNSTPCVNCIAIFDYNGTPHYALSEYLFPGGFYISESNKVRGKITERFIPWGDESFVGFYYDFN